MLKFYFNRNGRSLSPCSGAGGSQSHLAVDGVCYCCAELQLELRGAIAAIAHD